MKRGWFGAALLAGLLLLGIWSSRAMGRLTPPVRALEDASEAALAGSWPRALESAQEAEAFWEESWHLCAAFSSHEPMEEIDALFAQLRVAIREQDRSLFCQLCGSLARQMEALGDAHALRWWNLL